MTKLFLKNLAKNLLSVFAGFGIVYSFGAVGEKFFGDYIYGLLVITVLFLTVWILERSWENAKDETRDER